MKVKNLKLKIIDNSGVAILISILLIGILLSIVFTLSSLFTKKIKLSYYSKDTVVAIYAAETGAEWCLYRKKDESAAKPVMINGSSFEVNPIETTYQKGDGRSFSETDDSSIISSSPNWNMGTMLFVQIAPLGSRKALINFPNLVGNNLGQIPPNATISRALLRLSGPSSSGSGVVLPVTLHRILKQWNEGETFMGQAVEGEVTYTAAQYNLVPWETNGAVGPTDITAALPVTIYPATPDNPIHYTIDITSIVQDWANGISNYGILIQNLNPGITTYAVQSSENTSAERPLLSIIGSSCSIGDIKSIGKYRGTTRAFKITF